MSTPSADFSAGKFSRTRKARPERFRISLRGESGGIPLALPGRRLWPLGIFFAVAFLIFAAIAWSQIVAIRGHKIKSVFDLSILLFQSFWVLGWSVGVFILGALAGLFLFYGESARLRDGRLIHTPRLGPFRINVEYDLAKMRNLRLEPQSENTVRIRFDYGDGSNALGDQIPRPEAEEHIALIREAISLSPSSRPEELVASIPATPAEPAASRDYSPADKAPPLRLFFPSAFALIGANLLPIGGVLAFDWKVGDLMVLYWAESAVIGFWNVAKLAIVGKWAALLMVPFFVGHFGGFMAGHFLFIYYFFVRGLDSAVPEPGVWNALWDLFTTLQTALLTLFISHGVSFFSNYLGRHEYFGTTVKQQMAEPYKRIGVMHATILGGGFLSLVLRSPQPALLLLVILKTATDLRAHLREHARHPLPNFLTSA